MRPDKFRRPSKGDPFGNILDLAYDPSLPKRVRKKARARMLQHMSNTRRRK